MTPHPGISLIPDVVVEVVLSFLTVEEHCVSVPLVHISTGHFTFNFNFNLNLHLHPHLHLHLHLQPQSGALPNARYPVHANQFPRPPLLAR
jgi:hypothetical protein